MAGDLTGGLDPVFETFRPRRPTKEAVRDSATLWMVAGQITNLQAVRWDLQS